MRLSVYFLREIICEIQKKIVTLRTKSIVMNQKKYNSDEPVELATTNEPALAYGYAQDTHIYTPEPTKNIRTQRILEPDDDFRRAITGDELMKRMRVSIREIFAAGKQ